jgi:hypothetical protein
MAAPIQSPTKCKVRSVNAKGECPVEIHKQIAAVYGNIMTADSKT